MFRKPNGRTQAVEGSILIRIVLDVRSFSDPYVREIVC